MMLFGLDLLGLIGLMMFFGVLIASLKGWISQEVLPVQSALVLTSFILVIVAFLFGNPIGMKELMANIFLHPITALIGGFLVAGALEASGAFKAAVEILDRLTKTPFGLTGTVVILVNMPTIFAMPCGRILAAALMPAAILLGYNLARIKKDGLLVSIIVFGFIVNAAASCGPSPLGGIGMIGEGMGGYALGSFANAQQIGIMLVTAISMLSIRFVYKILPDESIIEKILSESGDEKKEEKKEEIPASGYFSFFFFIIGIAIVFITQPAIPIQTILIFFVLVIMLVSRISINDLIGGVILHPIMAMISGFIIAGALVAIGSFDVLIEILNVLVDTPLGYIGVIVILANIPTILPMPCGRIIAMALMPGILMFGREVSEMTGNEWIVPLVLTGFIINAAASCGPSPLGGIGGIGEGNLGTAIGISGRPQQVGIMVGTGAAVLLIGLVGFI